MITLIKMLDRHTPFAQSLLDSDSMATRYPNFDLLGAAVYVCSDHGEFTAERRFDRYLGREVEPSCPTCDEIANQIASKREVSEAVKQERIYAQRLAEAKLSVGVKFEKSKFEDFEVFNQPQRQAALNSARKVVEGSLMSLCLLGSRGVGKTTLASAIGNAFLAKGMTAMYFKETTLMREIRSSLQRGDMALFRALSTKLDLLCIDEIGREKSTDFALSMIQDLIDDRYRTRQATVLCSNLLPDAFWARMGDMVKSRIFEEGVVSCIGGEDLRMRKLKTKN